METGVAYNRKSVKNWAAIAGKVVELKIAFAIFLTLCYETPLASELTHLGLSKERLKLRQRVVLGLSKLLTITK